jgi:aspartyl-tRNA(Asn)/glutamyl-tRNA(Gln) amidotransferase subunit C
MAMPLVFTAPITGNDEKAMSLDNDDIRKLATLARIQVDDAIVDDVAHKISDILTLVEQMQAQDTSAVEPMANPLDAVQMLRCDEVTEVDRREAFQAIAPATENGLYLVPKVID